MGVADVIRGECVTARLHDDMTLDRLIVCTKLIEDSKLRRMDRNFKRGGSSDHEKTKVKKRAQTQ